MSVAVIVIVPSAVVSVETLVPPKIDNVSLCAIVVAFVLVSTPISNVVNRLVLVYEEDKTLEPSMLKFAPILIPPNIEELAVGSV